MSCSSLAVSLEVGEDKLRVLGNKLFLGFLPMGVKVSFIHLVQQFTEVTATFP